MEPPRSAPWSPLRSGAAPIVMREELRLEDSPWSRYAAEYYLGVAKMAPATPDYVIVHAYADVGMDGELHDGKFEPFRDPRDATRVMPGAATCLMYGAGASMLVATTWHPCR